MNYSKLTASIEQTFIRQDDYFFDKHVPEFSKDGQFLADYFNQLAVEPLASEPPRFYHTFSPYDVVSNKAPHRAVVFQGGELLLNIDFEEYVAMRTAVMGAVVLKALGHETLEDKKVLLFGAGNIATQSVKILASQLGLGAIDVITKSNNLNALQAAVGDVAINPGSINNIGQYDVIICHTGASSPVLTAQQLNNVKQGAVLASFISSSEHGELPDEAYDSAKANIITDWQQTVLGAKDLKRAIDLQMVGAEELIYLKDLLTKAVAINHNKQYTVYRSTGTPIQNLAVLKQLL